VLPLLALLTTGAVSNARADQFTIFIYETPSAFAARTDQAKSASYWGAYNGYAKTLMDAGILRGGTALHADADARTVRVKNGKAWVKSGSNAKAPQALGGYFVIEAKDLKTALQWAAKAPGAASGTIEVRPHYPNPTLKMAALPAKK